MTPYFKTYFTVPRPFSWKPFGYDRSHIKTICVFSEGDKIGDALFKVPLLKTLKNAFPEAKITYLALVHTAWATILKDVAPLYIDKAVEYVSLDDLSSYGHFDLVIDLNHRANVTLKLLKIDHTYFVSNTYGGMFGSFFSLYPMKKVHRVARHMLLLRKVGVRDVEMIFDPTLEVPSNITQEVQDVCSDLGEMICLLPAAGDRRRCWSLENYIKLAQKLLLENKKVIAIFGPQDSDMHQTFYDVFGDRIVYPLQTNPLWMEDYRYTMALCGATKLCVGNDSGVTHIAVAGGARLLALYGRVPPNRAAVIGENHEVIHKGNNIEEIAVKDVLYHISDMLNV